MLHVLDDQLVTGLFRTVMPFTSWETSLKLARISLRLVPLERMVLLSWSDIWERLVTIFSNDSVPALRPGSSGARR